MQLEPNLKAHQAMVSDKLHVHEVMTTQLLAVAPVGKVKDLVDVLQRCKHQAFPVTPDVSGAWQSGTPGHTDHNCFLSAAQCLPPGTPSGFAQLLSQSMSYWPLLVLETGQQAPAVQ